jgi:hypothetical protein
MLRHHLEERAKTEALLKKTNRALKALSKCNENLMQETSETELLLGICGILVEEGGIIRINPRQSPRIRG